MCVCLHFVAGKYSFAIWYLSLNCVVLCQLKSEIFIVDGFAGWGLVSRTLGLQCRQSLQWWWNKCWFWERESFLFNNSDDHDDELVILVDLWNIWQRTAAEGSLAKVSSFVTLASVRTCSLCWNQPLKSATHLNLNHHHHHLHHHNHHLYLYFHLHHHLNRRQNHI